MNEIQQEIRSQLERYRLKAIEPYMEEDDHNEHFRMEIFRELGELGFCGMPISSQYGGGDMGYLDFCVALEEIAKSSVSYAVTISVSTMVQSIISNSGTEEQKNKYLPELTSGREIGAFALSESSAGSDANALKTTAKKVKGGWHLNGTKLWITSGGIAKTYIVMAKTDVNGESKISSFIVSDGIEGFSYGKKEKKMGWKSSPTRELIFENCFVADENLIGSEGQGFKVALSALEKGRFTIGSIAVGLASRALDDSIRYSLERKQFNQSIYDFQGLQFMMADMATEIEASRLLVYKAAELTDQGTPSRKMSCFAKLKSTETCMKVTTDAVQIHGAVGYTTEYPVERFMRDAKVLQIVEGTNQVQKVVIGRCLKKEYSH